MKGICVFCVHESQEFFVGHLVSNSKKYRVLGTRTAPLNDCCTNNYYNIDIIGCKSYKNIEQTTKGDVMTLLGVNFEFIPTVVMVEQDVRKEMKYFPQMHLQILLHYNPELNQLLLA